MEPGVGVPGRELSAGRCWGFVGSDQQCRRGREVSVPGHTQVDRAFWLSARLGLALTHPSRAAQETGPGLWSGLCPPRRVAGWGPF